MNLDELTKTLAWQFEPSWCGARSCGGTHPEKNIYCRCAMYIGQNIIDAILESGYEIIKKEEPSQKPQRTWNESMKRYDTDGFLKG
jgi:hypothetical protein